MKKFAINTSNPYNVIIGNDILKKTGLYINDCLPPCKICLVTDSTVNSIYGQVVITSLIEHGYQTSKVVFPAGEHSKNINTYSNILEALASEGLTRSDALLALGGGVVGDMVGFTAATYMRGIPYIQVPTNYISAIDSSIGGKTGINLLSGKNLVGSFWQPRLVISDSKCFESVPTIKMLDGISEAIKYAVVSESSLIEHIVNNNYDYVIDRCISIKKSLVEADEKDVGIRQLLNFGHTIGHGIEKLSCFGISHGQAVAKGMVIEARAAGRFGLTDIAISKQLEEILTSLGFNLSVDYTPDELYQFALMDKKISGDKITLVIPESIGKCRLHKISLSELRDFISLGL